MATRKTHEARQQPASLTMSREKAATRLTTQIEEGKKVAGSGSETDFQHWDDFNRELMGRLFTDTTYVSEYDMTYLSVPVSTRPAAPFTEPPEPPIPQRVTPRVAFLQSLLKRLEIIDAPTDTSAAPVSAPTTKARLSKDVFVVHGHDNLAREEVSGFLRKCDLNPIVLHEQASGGRTVIEKLELYSDVSFAVVLLTPDDKGGIASENPAEDGTYSLQPRARQNVIAELFYFIGKLKRERVCALKKGNVEIPSDIGSVVYTPMDDAGAWKQSLLKELAQGGHRDIDWQKALS